MTIVPVTVHFVLQYERLEQAMLSLSKLSKKNKIIIIIINNNNKAVMQDTSHYHIYFLRVSSGATYYEKGITCRTHFNRYHGNVLQSNNDSTKKISLP